MKITKFVAAALSLILVGSVCSCSPKNEADAKVLLCYAGDSNDEFAAAYMLPPKTRQNADSKRLNSEKTQIIIAVRWRKK